MPFDERLAERVRALFAGRNDVREQKMFGGVGFLLRGNMRVGVGAGRRFVRRDPRAEVSTLPT